MTRAMQSGWLVVMAHALLAISGIVAVTVLALAHVIQGSDALLVVMATLGISGPSLGRPISVGPVRNHQLDG